MAEDDFVIVGLGNPGAKYEKTRHNVGFMLVDWLAGRENEAFVNVAKWQAETVRLRLWGERVLLVKPNTYMNRSGQAVAPVMRFYSLPENRLVVVHDDIDMAPGRVKLVMGGGTGGHNGIRSVVEHLGTADFYRLKIGVGRPGNNDTHVDMPVDRYVLADFSEAEQRLVSERFASIDSGLASLAQKDERQAMQLLNSLK